MSYNLGMNANDRTAWRAKTQKLNQHQKLQVGARVQVINNNGSLSHGEVISINPWDEEPLSAENHGVVEILLHGNVEHWCLWGWEKEIRIIDNQFCSRMPPAFEAGES
jgi:hypothetical protein